MGKTEKTGKKSCNYSDQNTKNQKTKIWDERNKSKKPVYFHCHFIVHLFNKTDRTT